MVLSIVPSDMVDHKRFNDNIWLQFFGAIDKGADGLPAGVSGSRVLEQVEGQPLSFVASPEPLQYSAFPHSPTREGSAYPP